MINAVIGDVVFINGQNLVLRSGGLEFSLVVSSQTAMKISRLESNERRNLRVLSYLQTRDDGISLFGFSDEEERQLFLELITVSGIGPKQAMKILSGISVHEFITALDGNDVKSLSRVPGLGVKTAQKIILALRDKLVDMDSAASSSKNNDDNNDISRRFDDLVVALTEMGYDKRKVVDTLSSLENANSDKLKGRNTHEQEELLFRLALNSL
jgi:holliday junction DNA helicase RuvA